MEEIKNRDYAIFIICFGRPQICKEYTWALLDKYSCSAKRFIVCSEDDVTMPEYKKMFGKDNVIVFNKEQTEKDAMMDLQDCYHESHQDRRGAVWARNALFKIARQKGYRYFMVFDDDYNSLRLRAEFANDKLCSLLRFRDHEFDQWIELQFRILDSAPWLYSVAMSQGGDYIGGVSSKLWREQYRFKAMNVYFFDTMKEHRYYGRMNEDTNAYVLNGMRGQLSFTMAGPQIDQLVTQQVPGGMTELYRNFGTYIKSFYSVMLNPSGVRVNTINGTRLHHSVNWKFTVPVIISDKTASKNKHKYLSYNDEVMKDKIYVDENFNVVVNKTHTLSDAVEPPLFFSGNISSLFF